RFSALSTVSLHLDHVGFPLWSGSRLPGLLEEKLPPIPTVQVLSRTGLMGKPKPVWQTSLN
ncbi:MAG: hypothetical protein AAF412_14350, partial [Pseudomonadota bacterium]